MTFKVVRKTILNDKKKKKLYPRPTRTFEKLFSGSKNDCEIYMNRVSDKKENKSWGDFTVSLCVTRDEA